MNRRTLATVIAAVLLASLTGCDSRDDTTPQTTQVVWDDDVCVPPTPSTSGEPWVEADDGEPCILDGHGGWTQAPEGPEHGGHANPRRNTRKASVKATTKPTTKTSKQRSRP